MERLYNITLCKFTEHTEIAQNLFVHKLDRAVRVNDTHTHTLAVM